MHLAFSRKSCSFRISFIAITMYETLMRVIIEEEIQAAKIK